MAEKVKVSQSDIKDLEKCLKFYFGDKELTFRSLTQHTNSELMERGFAIRLKDKFKPLELAVMINGDYEIEETTEEILLERYRQNSENRTKAIQNKEVYQEGYTLGYLIGVQDGLNFSGKKIKGIND